MKTRKINNLIVPVMFIIGVLLLFLYNKIVVQKKYEKNSRFTIGVIDNFNSVKGGAYVVYFHYHINNKVYNEFSNVGDKKVTKKLIGKKYLVTYIYDDEETSHIDLNAPIPDSILIAPINGWKKKPY